jgi:hypothetical protein
VKIGFVADAMPDAGATTTSHVMPTKPKIVASVSVAAYDWYNSTSIVLFCNDVIVDAPYLRAVSPKLVVSNCS